MDCVAANPNATRSEKAVGLRMNWEGGLGFWIGCVAANPDVTKSEKAAGLRMGGKGPQPRVVRSKLVKRC